MKNNKLKIMLHWISDSIYKQDVNKKEIKDFLEVYFNQKSDKRKMVKSRINNNLSQFKGELIPCILNLDNLEIKIIY